MSHLIAARMAPVTVLAVDDQAVFLRVLRDLIAAAPGFALVGEAGSGDEAIRRVPELHPDLVLLDVRMPGRDGFDTASAITQGPDPPVVVLISVDAVTRPPESCGARAHIRKQHLSVGALRSVWFGSA